MNNDDEFIITPAALDALRRGELGNAITAMTPGGIEAQEAAGQAAMVEAQQLPKEGLTHWRWYEEKYKTTPQEYLTSLGFEFGEDADDLFINVVLPEGWKLEATDHSMWSMLVDPDGRERASIFYKAAFYDRSAHMDLVRRYVRKCDYDQIEEKKIIQYHVYDGEKVIFSSDKFKVTDKHDPQYFADMDAAEEQAVAWLNENFPEWENPVAYWE